MKGTPQGTEGFPETGKPEGSSETRQELAAHVTAAETWAGPGAMVGDLNAV